MQLALRSELNLTCEEGNFALLFDPEAVFSSLPLFQNLYLNIISRPALGNH